MATLIELATTKKVVKLDPGLPKRAQEFRAMYASPRLIEWLITTLPNLESTWNIEISPRQQLVAFLEIYASDEPLTYGHSFKPLRSRGMGVWEMKMADLRVFGWFPMKDVFIASNASSTQTLKEISGLYGGYINEAVRFRELLDLDEPKFMPGDDPNAVVSNFCYPDPKSRR